MPRKRKKIGEQWLPLEFEESPKSVRTSDLPSPFSNHDNPVDADVVPIDPNDSLCWVSPQFIRGKTPYRKRNRRHQATIATQRLLNCQNTSSRKTQAKAKNKYRLKFQQQEMKQNSGDSDGDGEQTDPDPEDNKENEIATPISVLSPRLNELTDSEPPPGFSEVETPDINEIENYRQKNTDPQVEKHFDQKVQNHSDPSSTQHRSIHRARADLRKQLFKGHHTSIDDRLESGSSCGTDDINPLTGSTTIGSNRQSLRIASMKKLFSQFTVKTPKSQRGDTHGQVLVKDTPVEEYHLTVRQRTLRRYKDRRRYDEQSAK